MIWCRLESITEKEEEKKSHWQCLTCAPLLCKRFGVFSNQHFPFAFNFVALFSSSSGFPFFFLSLFMFMLWWFSLQNHHFFFSFSHTRLSLVSSLSYWLWIVIAVCVAVRRFLCLRFSFFFHSTHSSCWLFLCYNSNNTKNKRFKSWLK